MNRIIKPEKKNMKIYDSDKNMPFWHQVEEKSHYLIADILNKTLPLPNCRDKKIFNPNKDADYRNVLVKVVSDYGQDLPELEKASQEIAYEYLFLVVESLIGSLREFSVHKEEYLTKLF
ncbi:MAG: hypothetical protein MRERV_4c078 [Mycoplasmataceae bacterium RV_VA103A]|nr:MAG: hypothetical protein MRERV_11c035 [Mycoplasmataceae bacterium RV_VA103A]KLL05173.1 MAG: hypothetical protein MRERV_4c078 [Mycoplasmataceae bacterium RV_VA103A]